MDRPNILWLCTDQQRFDTIHALNNPHGNTPNLDRLCEEGVAFTHAYCQSPICTPSRASFLTGMYPSRVHGCMNGNDEWADAAPLVTKLLADESYDCGLSGKLHLSAAQGRIEKRPDDGYRIFQWSHGVQNDWEEGHAWADWLKSEGHDLGNLLKDREAIPPELHQTTWCADRAIDFIEEDHDKPWLFSFNCFDPHPPFDAPNEYRERYDQDALPGPLFRESDLEAQAKLNGIDFQSEARRPEEFDAKRIQASYFGMVELIDENVGRMLDALERTGQRENTMVIFMSDHGEMLGDHGLVQKGCRFYEGLVRVPLIISWPGHIVQGVRSEALVELTDIAPTLLDFAGLPVPDQMQGRSLHPILTGLRSPYLHREFVRCEYYHALVPHKGRGFEGTYATMIRDKRYKLVVYHGHDIGELFDLEHDPGEFENMWENPACADIKLDLMKKSFDALAFAVDVGAEQTAGF